MSAADHVDPPSTSASASASAGVAPLVMPPHLDDSDRRELLRIARVTLKEWLSTGRTPPGAPHRPALLAPGAAFVTVYVDGELRGCLGHVEPEKPLYKTIVELTVAAASRDPRFEPLRRAELDRARLSLSVLSPLVRVADARQVEVGKHGLLISQGPYRGLLLPQVAVEHGWDRETFLQETCRKAGLPRHAWRDPDAIIEVFTADVFEEPEPAATGRS